MIRKFDTTYFMISVDSLEDNKAFALKEQADFPMLANPDKKVGALNYGYFLSRGFDYVLGVDGDTTLARDCVERLELEMTDDPRIGGLSAIYTIDGLVRKRPAVQVWHIQRVGASS